MSRIAASFDALPTEIASSICSMIPQSDVCSLSLATKSLYQLVHPILYHHPMIISYDSLILFSRTFSEASYVGKADSACSNQNSRDQTKYLEINIDLRRNLQPPPAVMISRTIQAIVRHCPNLAITLRFSYCRCYLSPVSALGTETFPRVTKLLVHVGERDPENGLSHVRRTTCGSPSAAFWRRFVNGEVFPDCLDLEIRHYWATTPPLDASLDLQEPYHFNAFPAPSLDRLPQAHPARRFGRARPNTSPYLPNTELIGSTNGIKKFRTIVLECPTELNSLLFMQLLGNPDAVASSLTTLEIRFCNLDELTISQLLYHAPPKVKRLVLLCCDPHDDSVHDRINLDYRNPETHVHLCPLIRKFGKDLVYLDYGAPTVCRELFFDDNEMQTLKENGIETRLGIKGGATDQTFVQLDGHAVRETIQSCRKEQKTKNRIKRVKEAVGDAQSQMHSGTPSSAANRARRETEALLDEEEEKRARLIEGSKEPWFRRIITYHGLCNGADTWAEMQIAADMDEKGIEWVLANKKLQKASQHSNGKPSIEVEMEEAMRAIYRLY